MRLRLKRAICRAAVAIVMAERPIDRHIRPTLDRFVRPPAQAGLQWLVNALRTKDRDFAIGEERVFPGEAEAEEAIYASMAAFLRKTYPPGKAERAGNTKTYGIVRGEFTVRGDLPEKLRVGLFAEPKTYPAWVRFAGPGPLSPPDLKDNGVLSIGIKLMGVPGPKLFDDETATQDFTGIAAPTFTTPDVFANAQLQKEIGDDTAIWYFLNPLRPHYLDALMAALYAKVHSSPLETPYWSCVPYAFGRGQAIKYQVRPASRRRTPVPAHPGDNYLREAMAATLAKREARFDFLVQLQTNAVTMPIENASVIWPEKESPWVPVARLTLPPQRFDSPEQLAFAHNLSYNPWHSMAEHRPLGNQNRARRGLYSRLARLRQEMNLVRHIEPDGSESFPQ